MKTLEEEFRNLLSTLASRLTSEDIDQIQELVDANELGVAFENFCTQLYERDATCSYGELSQIASIGTAMGIKSDYWEILETN